MGIPLTFSRACFLSVNMSYVPRIYARKRMPGTGSLPCKKSGQLSLCFHDGRYRAALLTARSDTEAGWVLSFQRMAGW